MAATVLADNLVSQIPVAFTNAEGAAVPTPTGGAAPTVTLDDTAAGSVAIAADGESVVFTPTQPPVDGTAVNITATYSYSDGSTVVVAGAFQVGTAAVVPPPSPMNAGITGVFNEALITTSPLP